jgi:hypothetical protein
VNILCPSRPELGPTHPSVQLVLDHSQGVKQLGMVLTKDPNLNTDVKERVEQHLYSPPCAIIAGYRVIFIFNLLWNPKQVVVLKCFRNGAQYREH